MYTLFAPGDTLTYDGTRWQVIRTWYASNGYAVDMRDTTGARPAQSINVGILCDQIRRGW